MSGAKFAETQDDGSKDLFGGSLVATADKAARAEWLKSAFGGAKRMSEPVRPIRLRMRLTAKELRA